VEITSTETTKEFLVQSTHFDDEATAKFSEQIAVYELTSH